MYWQKAGIYRVLEPNAGLCILSNMRRGIAGVSSTARVPMHVLGHYFYASIQAICFGTNNMVHELSLTKELLNPILGDVFTDICRVLMMWVGGGGY